MRRYTLLALVVTLALVGAACGKKPAATSVNTNTAVVLNVNTIPTNSSTTGSFSTDLSNLNTSAPVGTLTITASGMSQKTLTVANGTVVTFVNDDSVAHQIASDPHPAHTDLPGFDGLINPGQSYTFLFNRTGNWGYHDHLDGSDAKFKGTIVVK